MCSQTCHLATPAPFDISSCEWRRIFQSEYIFFSAVTLPQNTQRDRMCQQIYNGITYQKKGEFDFM